MGRFMRGASGLVALGLVVAACGGSEDDESSPTDSVVSSTREEATSGTSVATDAPDNDDGTAPNGSGDHGATTLDESAAGSDLCPGAGEGFRIGLVHSQQLGDQGWEDAARAGAEAVKAVYPDVELTSIESTPPGQTLVNALERLAGDGYDLVIGTGSQFTDDIMRVAPNYPETAFLTAAQQQTADNVGQYYAAIGEGEYLLGILAGGATESNVIGIVNSFPLPVLQNNINGFAAGVKSVNPDATVKVINISSFYDPTLETQAANSLADAGADVLTMLGVNSPALASVAERRGLRIIGYGSDLSAQAPNAWIGTWLYNWGPIYIDVASDIMCDRWNPSVLFYTMAEDGFTMSPVDESISTFGDYETALAALSAGELNIWTGPISDNAGNVVIAEGEALNLQQVQECCEWLFETVEMS